MQYRFAILLLFSLLAQLLSAQPQENSMRLSPTIKGETLEIDREYQIQALGENVRIERLRFYLSHLEFLRKGAVIGVAPKKYWLVDAENPTSLAMPLPADLPPFDAIRFQLGIDSATNVSGVMGGDLDPTRGMYWTWQSGYVNFKLEGSADRCPTRKHRFQYHIGGYMPPFAPLQTITLPCADRRDVVVNIALERLFEQLDPAESHTVTRPGKEALRIARLLPALFSIAP